MERFHHSQPMGVVLSKHSGPAVVAAPEPSTWAMMLIGFLWDLAMQGFARHEQQPPSSDRSIPYGRSIP